MAEEHRRLNGPEFVQILGDSEGRGRLVHEVTKSRT